MKNIILDVLDSHKVRIVRDENDTLFRAVDVGKFLSISNIYNSIRDFDEDEVSRNGRGVFLTEEGVFRLVMRSDKPMAKIFKKYVFDVIKIIRKSGKYKESKN